MDYTVLRPYLLQYPKLLPSYGQRIELPELDEDIGHTFVHYFYTGTYQTLKPRDFSGNIDTATEYRRSVLVYCAARKYGLDGLVLHAKGNMGSFDKGLSIFEILGLVREVYPKLPADEVWLPDYLKEKIKAAFEVDETLFTKASFLDCIGKVVAFDRALVKGIVEIYTGKIAGVVHKEEGVSWETPQVVQEAESAPEPEIEDLAEAESALVSKHQHIIESELAVEPAPADTYAPEPSLEEPAPAEAKPAEADGVEETTAPQEEPSMEESAAESLAESVPGNDTFETPETSLEPIAEFKLETEPELAAPEDPEEPAGCEEAAPEETPASEGPILATPTPCEKSFTHAWFGMGKGSKKRKKNKKTQHYLDIAEPFAEPKPPTCDPSTDCPPALADSEPAYDPTIEYTAEAEPVCDSEIELPAEAESAFESEVENSVCAFRAKHLLNGDLWKNCRKCRAIIRQVSLQLAREEQLEGDGY